jgi:hypothetical protein
MPPVGSTLTVLVERVVVVTEASSQLPPRRSKLASAVAASNGATRLIDFMLMT